MLYVASRPLNIKIMTSQQRRYLLLRYFYNKINILEVCVPSIWHVHSIVTNKCAKFGAKYSGISWIKQFSCWNILLCLTLYVNVCSALSSQKTCNFDEVEPPLRREAFSLSSNDAQANNHCTGTCKLRLTVDTLSLHAVAITSQSPRTSVPY